MKNRLLPAFALAAALFAATAWGADVRYVRDTLLINLRAAPGAGAETLKLLRTGDRLEVLSEEGEYLRVRDGEGVVGFVPGQYVMAEEPATTRLAAAETEASRLKKENAELSADLARVRETSTVKTRTAGREAETAQAQAADLAAKLTETERRYAKLLDVSGRAEEIAAENARLSEENARLTDEAENLRAEASGEKMNEAIKWFIAGAFALLLGWGLGMLSARKKRAQPFR